MMATNTCQSVSTPGVAVKATYQSKVWVGGKKRYLSNHLLCVIFFKRFPIPTFNILSSQFHFDDT